MSAGASSHGWRDHKPVIRDIFDLRVAVTANADKPVKPFTFAVGGGGQIYAHLLSTECPRLNGYLSSFLGRRSLRDQVDDASKATLSK